ncbi:hypothetical protein GCM10029992_29720 [Glycomyces albus]
MSDWPSVGVVIPTHNRPRQVREALRSVLTQFYPGRLEAVVVFDRAKPDEELASEGDRPVRVVKNDRTRAWPGPATPASPRWRPI